MDSLNTTLGFAAVFGGFNLTHGTYIIGATSIIYPITRHGDENPDPDENPRIATHRE